MESVYELKENDKSCVLFGKTGIQLISFSIENQKCFRVSYNNTKLVTIDFIGFD